MSNAECRSLAAADDYEFDKPITVFPHWFIMNNLLTCAVQEYFIDHDPHRITSPEVGYLNELMSMIGAPIIVPFDNLDNPDRPCLENIYVGHIHASSRGSRLKKSKLAEQAKLGVDTRCYTYRELSACSPTIPFATSFV